MLRIVPLGDTNVHFLPYQQVLLQIRHGSQHLRLVVPLAVAPKYMRINCLTVQTKLEAWVYVLGLGSQKVVASAIA